MLIHISKSQHWLRWLLDQNVLLGDYVLITRGYMRFNALVEGSGSLLYMLFYIESLADIDTDGQNEI